VQGLPLLRFPSPSSTPAPFRWRSGVRRLAHRHHGVGGGFLIVPAMIYLLRMPTRMQIGTSTFQIVCVTAVTTVLQAMQNHSVDAVLALPLILGGVVGAQYGVGFAEKLKAEQLRAGLAVLVLAVAARMALGLVVTPGDLYTIEAPPVE
jgi:hypothetical protein